MNNLLTDLLNTETNTNPYQIHYYENINIYPDRSTRNTRTPTAANTRSTRRRNIPIPPNQLQSDQTRLNQRASRQRRSNREQPEPPQNNNQTTYTETIEIEPIITSVSFNPLDNNLNSVFNRLTNTFLNLSQSQTRNEPITLYNLNSLTNLITTTDNREFLSENEKCSICSEHYNENQIIRQIIRCNHSFHHRCIDTWLSTNSTCPICTTNLNTIPENNNAQSTEVSQPSQTNI